MLFDRLRTMAPALTVSLLIGSPVSMTLAHSGSLIPEPRFTFEDTTPAQIDLVNWASALFDQAGLELPPIRFFRHDQFDECGGRPGRASYDNGVAEIHICTDDATPAEEFLFLHEMGHAWEFHTDQGDRRERFLELRGISEWHNADLHWGDQGAEQAAQIMVWGLMDRPVWPATLRGDTDCRSLLAAYETLTGNAPLHGYTDYCD